MCGINGIISLTGKPIENLKNKILSMNELLYHRGPDYDGIFISEDKDIGIGNTRLSIVDAVSKFNVPFKSKDGNYILSYNGEIYNFKELKKYLIGKGVYFSTNSDTEVLMQGLIYSGKKFLKLIDGCWSFCFYDNFKKEVLLSRDLLGEKSLYYYINSQEELLFSSEIPPILRAAEKIFDIDFNSAVSSFMYRASQPGKTLIKDIFKLKSGKGIFIKIGNRNLTKETLQKLNIEKYIEFFKNEPSEDEVLELYEKLLLDSCLLRKPNEVKFVNSLSGGIDSGILAYYTNKVNDSSLNTIFGLSQGQNFQNKLDISEIEASRLAAKKIKSNHYHFNMFKYNNLQIYRKQAANSYDGIFCEGVISYQLLAKQAKEMGAKVLINSDGGDEVLCGYDVDKKLIKNLNYFSDKKLRKKLLIFFINKLSNFGLYNNNFKREILNLSNFQEKPLSFKPSHGGTELAFIKSIFIPELLEQQNSLYGTIRKEYKSISNEFDISQKLALSYACNSMPDYFNTRSDRGIMRESVEVRLPMQSLELVALMISTPMNWKLKNNFSKYPLRKLVEQKISKKIAFRKKQGFAQPIWVKEKFEKELKLEEVIRESEIFRNEPFSKEAKKYLISKKNKRERWFAYSLSLVKNNLKNKSYT